MAALLLVCGVTASAQDPKTEKKTWEFEGADQWSLVETPTTRPVGFIENPTLDSAERLLSERRHGRARPIISRWLKGNPDAPDRDRGLFLLAEAYFQYGDRVRAFYHLDELMDFYPESRLFVPALEKQYAIADAFLRGYKRRFLRLPLLGAQDEGIEILYRIQERAPGSPIAERALLRTADYYYNDAQYDLASDAYAAYVRSYPRSEGVATGRIPLRQAFASLAQFRGLRFDATPLIDAKTQLEAIVARHPELAQQENLAGVLERIDRTLAARVYATADFYRRTNEPQAAAYNLRYLIASYPETAEAERARRQLERLPQWALELPAPEAAEEPAGTPGEPIPPTELEGPQPTNDLTSPNLGPDLD